MSARFGIGRERRLAGAREAEEQRDVGRVLLVHVGRAVHREHAHLGHVVVHRVEDALLDLAGVLGAEDHHDLAAERLRDQHRALDAQSLACSSAVSRRLPGVDDGPVADSGPV